MEIKIPKEIRAYRESVLFGLSLRQLICSIIAVVVAVLSYFGLRDLLGQEMVSWVCIFCAAPFAAAGFFSYNSMTLEKFIVAWIRSEILCAGPRKFIAENLYVKLLHSIQNEPKSKKRRSKARQGQAAKAGGDTGKKRTHTRKGAA